MLNINIEGGGGTEGLAEVSQKKDYDSGELKGHVRRRTDALHESSKKASRGEKD